MAVYRLQCSIGADTAFPRDRVMINPHFNNVGGPLTDSDTDQLCEDLADALVAYVQGTREISVKAYDAQGTVPVFPTGNAIRNVGAFPASSAPRELACCLSFYSGQNVPRRRGRLFVPVFLVGAGVTHGVRPGGALIAKVGQLAQIMQDLGGADIDWSVFSRVDDTARAVTNWWVDDEWDAMRSRGLRPETRTTGVTSEES